VNTAPISVPLSSVLEERRRKLLAECHKRSRPLLKEIRVEFFA